MGLRGLKQINKSFDNVWCVGGISLDIHQNI